MGCLFFKSKLLQDVEKVAVKTKRKLVLVGLDCAGKTTILSYLKLNKFQESVPTIGLNVESIKYKNLELLVFDLGGKVRSLWSHYYENLDCVIFVVDSSDRVRVKVVREEMMKLTTDLKNNKASILVMFNKQDLDNCIDFKTLIDESGVNDIIDHDVIVQRCSAKTGQGVEEGLDKLCNYFINMDKKLTMAN